MKLSQFLLLIGLFMCVSFTYAQRPPFVRVFDLNGKKIYKGRITSADESYLYLKKGSKMYTVPFDTIGSIKTYRSFGHYAGGGAGYAALTGVLGDIILFSLYSSSEDPSGIGGGVMLDAALIFPAALAVGGFITGTVIWLLKKKENHEIHGDPNLWEIFRSKYYDGIVPPKELKEDPIYTING